MATKNKVLAKKIRDHILAEPLRLNMADYLNKKGEEEETLWGYEWDTGREYKYPKCGTAACIAGWAYLLSGAKKLRLGQNIHTRARRLLGLTEKESHTLFTGNWYSTEEYDSGSRRKRAQMAAEEINKLFGLKRGELK